VRRVVPPLVMLGCGWAHGLCFPPARVHALAWVVLVPAFVVLRRAASATRAALLAALLAFAGTVATVGWLPGTVAVYYEQPIWLGLALFVGVTLVMVVPPLVAFALCYRVLSTRGGVAAPLLAGAAWVAVEYWRAHVLTGNPWVLLGYSQVGATAMQVADVGGVYAVSFVLVAANAALAEAALGRPRAVAALAVAVALALGTWAYGRRALAATPAGTGAVPVVVVQDHLDLGSQWRPELYGRNLDAYLKLTLQALRASPARLVVWPEGAMTFFLEREAYHRAAIAAVLAPFGADLVAGGPHAVTNGGGDVYFNSVFAVDPSGAVRARYDKQQLLPFAEYFPLAAIGWLRRDFGDVREFTPGAPTPPLPTAAGRAGVLVCNEALFAEPARVRVGEGAQILVVVTNDTWVGDPTFANIALDMTVLRAVETRRWLVRASTWGPSAIVDPAGRVTAMSGVARTETLAGTVAPREGTTLYARAGDAFALACIGGTLAALALTRCAGRSRRGVGSMSSAVRE
jgi:apolipoprotein N-acyltransferase